MLLAEGNFAPLQRESMISDESWCTIAHWVVDVWSVAERER